MFSGKSESGFLPCRGFRPGVNSCYQKTLAHKKVQDFSWTF